jgi:hypothetical protein
VSRHCLHVQLQTAVPPDPSATGISFHSGTAYLRCLIDQVPGPYGIYPLRHTDAQFTGIQPAIFRRTGRQPAKITYEDHRNTTPVSE